MSLNLIQIAAAAAEPVTLAEAKAHLRIDDSFDDSYISSLITVATSLLDGPFGQLGRCLINSTWQWHCLSFDNELQIPLLPLGSVVSVKYINTDGQLTTLDPSFYDVDQASGKIRLAYGQVWPSVRAVYNAVQVTFVAGYGATSADVPAPLKQAILLMVSHFYENREAGGFKAFFNTKLGAVSTVKALLSPYKTGSVLVG